MNNKKRQSDIAQIFNAEPPHSLQAEAALLGAILHEASIVPDVAALVHAEDFWTVKHRTIYTAMLDIFTTSDSRLDLVTLHTLLTDRGVVDQIGDLDYLVDLVDSTPHAAGANSYAAIIVEKARKRKTIEVLSHAVARTVTSDAPTVDIIRDGCAQLTAIASDAVQEISRPISETVTQVIQDLRHFYKSGDDAGALKTDLKDLNQLTGGFRSGQVIVVAAGTNVGKSAFGLHLALTWAKKGHVVAVFSMEMTHIQLAERILAAVAGVDLDAVTKRRTPTADELANMEDAGASMVELPILIIDAGNLTLMKLASAARFVVNHQRAEALVIDYLQLINGNRQENRNVEISEISRFIKQLAVELNVPIVVLSQLNREASRNQRRPLLHDLRDSGSIEQDADVVLFLHDPQSIRLGPGYEPDATRELELLIAKQRPGPRGAFRICFDGPRQCFRDLETDGNTSQEDL